MSNEKPKALAIPISPVASSSNIFGWGYDATTKTLAVQFKTGQLYHYANVPQDVVDDLRKAESVGGFLASRVIRAGYVSTKVEQPKGD